MISLYAKGLTTGDIQQHLLEIYGTEVSTETISKITDQIVEEMTAWQSRPLDPLYAVLLLLFVFGGLIGGAALSVVLGVVFPTRRFSPPLRRCVDIAEAILIASMLPLALAVMDLYQTFRQL